MSSRRSMNDPFATSTPPLRSHLAAAWREDGPLLFARIVWYTPLIALAAAIVTLLISVTSFVGLVLLTALIKTWWVGATLSLLVIVLARRRNAHAVRLGLSALALSLFLAALGFIVFR